MTDPSQRPMQSNSGNMLIYIIGAIMLLGILIVIVKGNVQEGTSIDVERVALKAAEVQRYVYSVKNAVNTVMDNGYGETEIRFAHPNAHAAYGAITSIPERQVFSPSGGNAEYIAPPAGVQLVGNNYTYGGQSEIAGVGTTCAAVRCTDLVAYLGNVSKEFCMKINDMNGITNPSGSPPIDTDGFQWNTAYAGTFTAGGTISTTGNHTFGKHEGCVDTGGTYYYYHVLIAR